MLIQIRYDDTHDTDIDPITLEVTRNAAAAVCEEMNATLIRTSYSPNIKERQDCSCALFDRDAQMIAQAETIPVHLGAMPFSVRAAIEQFPPSELSPGDAIAVNDPFAGGAHLPDLTLITPVYDNNELIGFAANRAHHADIGGAHAGSVAADSTEIYQEGLRIPPVKLFEAGEQNSDVFELILTNVRTPDERRGDLRAQKAANETGRQRFEELANRYDTDTLPAAIDAIKDYSERRMRAEIESLPDGEYSFRDVLDDDGTGNKEITINVTVTVEADTVHVDFTGTAEQTAGPINAVLAVTTSATYYAIRCLTDPDIPPNHGCYRPISIEAPSGTVINPDPPAAVVGGNLETSQRITDVVLGAFGKVTPERIIAGSQGTMNNVTFGGTDPRDGTQYSFYETQGGGFGGRAGKDGLDGVHVHMSNTLNTPAEVLETAYPLRVMQYSLRPDSGGAGEYRGGLGIRRDIQVLDHEATFSLLADRHDHQPYGLAGGSPGDTGSASIDLVDGDSVSLDQKITRTLPAGSIVSIRTPGGGGYGNPVDRDEDKIKRDLNAGKLAPSRAREVYDYDSKTIDDADLGSSDDSDTS
jgi:N-methylhydantoinase B/acetone carboxylase, alpha subunit